MEATTERSPWVIEVENLVAHYGQRLILNGVGLQVGRGEIVVVMGGSGSGKSTLLRHVLALEKPTAGVIRLLGREIQGLSLDDLTALRRKIGVAFQGGALFSSLTVGQNIMLPLLEHTRLDRRTMEIMVRMKLEVVELAGCENLLPSQLSGGMLKRAALARAIAMDPVLLICDEPTSGLDPSVSSALDDLLLRLREAMGMSVLVVTHEVASTLKIADRVTILDHGQILFEGDVNAFQESDHPRIRDLLYRQTKVVTPDPLAYLDRLTGMSPVGGVS